MGWQDRDWARLDDDERRRLYGIEPARQGVPILERTVSIHKLALLLAALAAVAFVAWRPFGNRNAQLVVQPLPLLPAARIDMAAPSGRLVTWPGGVVRFSNQAPDQEWAVQQAMAAWNRSGAHVELIEAPVAEADVVIRHTASAGCSRADATVGDVPGAFVEIYARDDTQPTCSRYSAAVALTHEFGHVLGLGHTTGTCSAMNPTGSLRGPGECSPVEPWEWYCRLLEPGDVQRAIALYGGVERSPGDRGCALYQSIPAPMALRLDPTRDGSIAFSFSRPPDAVLPPFLARGTGEDSFSIDVNRGVCLGRPTGTRYRWTGDTERFDVGRLPPLSFCLEVWAYDRLGRQSAVPATLRVDAPG